MIFRSQRSCNKLRVFWSRVENIQNIHVCFSSKIITQLMFTTKFHLVSCYKLYRALLTSFLCVFLMMERPFHFGFCFSSVSSCWSHCAMSFIGLGYTRTTGVHFLLILSLGPPQAGVIGFFWRSQRSPWLQVRTTSNISVSLQMTFLFIKFYLQLILDQNLVYWAWQPVFLSASCHSQGGYLMMPFCLVCLSSNSWL